MNSRTDLKVGERVELEVTGAAHGGIMVARLDGRVVFVADAIPGETVVAEVTDARKKSFARATTVEVLKPSSDRTQHVWAEAALERLPGERVGGAEFGHILLDRQRSLKAEVLNDAMARFGKMQTSATVAAVEGDSENDGLGWRSRVRLHTDPETGIVGPYAARSRRVVSVSSLPLANEQINLIAPLGEPMPDVQSIDVIAPSNDDPRSLFTYHGSKQRVGEHDKIFELVGEREFMLSAGGFWQVHRAAPETLFEYVKKSVLDLQNDFDPAALNLDLYGGVGLFAAALLEAGGSSTRVTSVETDSNATDNAAENLSGFVGAMAVTERVDRFLSNLLKQSSGQGSERARAGTVVLDPPRNGAGSQVTESLGRLSPKNIIYVACDPVAFARDTQALTSLGYTLKSLEAFDLFPHTHHFETIGVFQRQ